MLKMVLRLGLGPVLVTLGLALAPALLAAPLEPGARDRVLSASVQLAVGVRISADGATYPTLDRVTVGSGTVVSPTGPDQLARRRRGRQSRHAGRLGSRGGGPGRRRDVRARQVGILRAHHRRQHRRHVGVSREVVEESRLYDFAVLQVTADAYGDRSSPSELDLAYVEIGDSEAVCPADPVYVSATPTPPRARSTTAAASAGSCSRAASPGPAWITSDAETFYGSSGGAAVDVNGAKLASRPSARSATAPPWTATPQRTTRTASPLASRLRCRCGSTWPAHCSPKRGSSRVAREAQSAASRPAGILSMR